MGKNNNSGKDSKKLIISNNVTGGYEREFRPGKNNTMVSDWEVDNRNKNFETYPFVYQ